MSNLTLFEQQLKFKANSAPNANAAASQKNPKVHRQCQSFPTAKHTFLVQIPFSLLHAHVMSDSLTAAAVKHNECVHTD